MRDLVASVGRELGVPDSLVTDALDWLTPQVAPLVAAQVAALEAGIGTGVDVAWPAADERLQLLALLGAVPAARRWFASEGIAADVADASLVDLGVKLRDYGVTATGIDWLSMVVTGRVFALGRLQFEAASPGSGGGAAWNTHIPESGPLDPAACDESFARAVEFFAARGDTTTRAFACHSWLLDGQLAEYLPVGGNILLFQRRFEPVDTAPVPDAAGATAGDHAMAKFVFRTPLAELATVQPRTTLERAVLTHLASGRHWHEAEGVLRLP